MPRSAALADGSRDIAVDGPVVEYSLYPVSDAFGRWYKSLRTAGVFVVRNAFKNYFLLYSKYIHRTGRSCSGLFTWQSLRVAHPC